jgi:hypothetical protein
MNSTNLAVNIICIILVTYTVITIARITSKLLHHLKDDTNMIWSHLILFNLFTASKFLLVIYGWDDGISGGLGLFMACAFIGFLEQVLITAVIV